MNIWKLESGSKDCPKSPHHLTPPKQFPPVWRWRWGCWNSHWIFSAYPGSHEGIIPKAFQELDPGFMQSQLMLALQIGICPHRTEAGHELSFILAIVRCLWLLTPYLRAHTQRCKLHIHFRPQDQQIGTFMHVCRCSHKHTQELHNYAAHTCTCKIMCTHRQTSIITCSHLQYVHPHYKHRSH